MYLLIACLLSFVVSGPQASAQMANQMTQAMQQQAALERPLMVIRFNQRRVFYQQPLYTALSRAVEVSPAVKFHLVSYVPAGKGPKADRESLTLANKHLQEVVGRMRQMGVPPAHIAVNNELSPELDYDEVHIYVR